MVDNKKLVRYVLERHPDAKDSDFRLYGWCCAMVKPDVMNLPFKEVMWRHKELELPSFDTIQRTRQQLQHDHPELRGEAYKERMKKAQEYREKYGRYSDI
jgi:hypothetical protein